MKFKNYLLEATEALKDWESYVKDNPELFAAVKILKNLEKLGYKAYIVGGCVRDLILGNKIFDIDICTNCPIEVLEKEYKNHTYNIGKSKDFGIIALVQDNYSFEVAQFRKDGSYLSGRRPESIEITGSFQDDASRRDFTINTLGIDSKGNILDYFDGQKDIKNKVLRAVGDPRKRFEEDYLRMLRAGRFSAKLGFDVSKDTGRAIKKLSAKTGSITPERVYQELMKAASMSGDKFADYIKILDRLKILKYILPEVQNLKWFKERRDFHPEGLTSFDHTMEALKKVGADKPISMLATLLHDIGKGPAFDDYTKGGIPSYFKHEEKSVDMVREIAKRLRMPKDVEESILFAVGNHMKMHLFPKMKPSKIIKLIDDDNWDVLAAVGKADSMSRGSVFGTEKEYNDMIDKYVKMKESFGKDSKKLKLVDGTHVMELTGLGQGRRIGEIIKIVTDWILDNNVKDSDLIDDYIRKLGNEIKQLSP